MSLDSRWADAAKVYRQALSLNRDDRYPWLWLAPSLILSGDDDGYRNHCREMVMQFGSTDRPDVADVLCKALLLKPGLIDLTALPVQQLRDATTDSNWEQFRPYFCAACALVSYREGTPEQAIGWTEKVGSWGPPGALAMLVRAMSEHQLGNAVKAMEFLDQAEAMISVELRTLGTDVWKGELPTTAEVGIDWQIAEIIRREASRVVTGSTK